MLLKFCFTVCLVVTTIAAAEISQRSCGTKDTSDSMVYRKRALEYANFRKQHVPISVGQGLVNHTIRVCFHVPQYRLRFFQRRNNRPYISNEQLQDELNHLNKAFSSSSCCDSSLYWCNGECSVETGISFVMARGNRWKHVVGTVNSTSSDGACITRRKGRRWMTMVIAEPAKERRIKRRLKVGDESVLNIYYIRSFVQSDGSGQLLGFATVPWDYREAPRLDGVVVEPNSIRGGSMTEFNESDTLIHEVGHWLGLQHTFFNGCSSPGDNIDDTPYEQTANGGCFPNPANPRDTCPGNPGYDPIFNFLDFSYDACLYQFTNEQAQAMNTVVSLYRSESGRKSRHEPEITPSGRTGPYFLKDGETQIFKFEVPKNMAISCKVAISTTEDDFATHMNWHGGFETFDCTLKSTRTRESCTLTAGGQHAFLFVTSVHSSNGFYVSCETNDRNSVLL